MVEYNIDPGWSWEEFNRHYPTQDIFLDEDDYNEAIFISIARQQVDKLGPQIVD